MLVWRTNETNKFWTWNGRELANPFTIIRCVVTLPVYLVLKVLITVVSFLGWGLYEAGRTWDDL